MWDNVKNLFDLKAVSSVSIPKYKDLKVEKKLFNKMLMKLTTESTRSTIENVDAKNTIRIALAGPGAEIKMF